MSKSKKKKFNYKNVSINREPLAITKIGEIESSSQNPLFVLFLFIILIAFVFFLPNLVNLFDKETVDNYQGENKNPISNNEEEPSKEMIYYDMAPSLSITLDEVLKIDQFQLVGNTIQFTITNLGKNRYYFNRHSYYLELYSENKTLLERIKLKEDNLLKDESKRYSYTVKNEIVSNVKKIVFVEKEENDYPNIQLSINEMGEGELVCVKDFETLTYRFKDEQLMAITDDINYDSRASDYESQKALYKESVISLNLLTGVTSNFIDIGSGFVFNVQLELKNVKSVEELNPYYYPLDTLAKVVDFEMKAQGFSCR